MTISLYDKPMTEWTKGDLRRTLDRLHEDRERYDRANRIVEARSCDLEIAEATRALAIINRRATEAEDQRQVEERSTRLPSAVLHMLADYKRKLEAEPSSLPGYDQTEQEERRRWLADQIGRIERVFADQQLETVCEAVPAQPTLTEDEVRAVVREACVAVERTAVTAVRIEQLDAIIDHAAAKLAGRVALSDGDRDDLDGLRAYTAASTDWSAYPDPKDAARALPIPARWIALLDRLRATEPRPAVDPAQREGLAARLSEIASVLQLENDEQGTILRAITELQRIGVQRLDADLRQMRESRVVEQLRSQIDALQAQREADLREAYVAGVERAMGAAFLDQRGVDVGAQIYGPTPGDVERLAAEYARSKAGA